MGTHQKPGNKAIVTKQGHVRLVVCDYCSNNAKLVGGEYIYPHRPDLYHLRFWVCAPCDAYVGTHVNSNAKPFGRLANEELRKAKSSVHSVFDPIWKQWIKEHNVSKALARNKGYELLALAMDMHPSKCHIGMFDLADCAQALSIIHSRRDLLFCGSNPFVG